MLGKSLQVPRYHLAEALAALFRVALDVIILCLLDRGEVLAVPRVCICNFGIVSGC